MDPGVQIRSQMGKAVDTFSLMFTVTLNRAEVTVMMPLSKLSLPLCSAFLCLSVLKQAPTSVGKIAVSILQADMLFLGERAFLS